MDALGAKTSAPFSITVNAPVVLANETESFVEDLVDNKLDKLSEAGDLPSFTVTFHVRGVGLGGLRSPSRRCRRPRSGTRRSRQSPRPQAEKVGQGSEEAAPGARQDCRRSVVTEQTVATQVQFVEALSDSTDLDPEFRENAVGLLSGLVGKIAEGSGSSISSSPSSGGGPRPATRRLRDRERQGFGQEARCGEERRGCRVQRRLVSSCSDRLREPNGVRGGDREARSKFEGIIRQLGRAQAGDMLEGEKPRRVKQGRISIQSQKVRTPAASECEAALAAALQLAKTRQSSDIKASLIGNNDTLGMTI